MSEKQTLRRKLFEAKKWINSQTFKKEGKNKFSKYDYYTPEQVEGIAIKACDKFGIDYHFSLKIDEHGVYGSVEIVDLDMDCPPILFVQRSAVPEIKATNKAQQYGGAMTYTKRYLLQNIFGIAENDLDFDSDNSAISPQKEVISDAQKKLLFAKASEYKIPSEKMKEMIKTLYGVDSSSQIPKKEFNLILEKLEGMR